MDMAQVSAGLQIGGGEYETLIVFRNPTAMEAFIESGWEFGAGGGAAAGAAGKTVGGESGEKVMADALYYTLTKNGLQAGGAVAGTKFWKDRELN
jgi:lipid-binding SYLF domain-containing protein